MISRSIINKGAKPSISDIQETFLECVSDSLACVLRLSGENTDLGLKRGSDEFEDEFDGSFALGPGGVGLMMETMNKVYDFIVSDMLLHDDSSVKELTELFEAADQVSQSQSLQSRTCRSMNSLSKRGAPGLSHGQGQVRLPPSPILCPNQGQAPLTMLSLLVTMSLSRVHPWINGNITFLTHSS